LLSQPFAIKKHLFYDYYLNFPHSEKRSFMKKLFALFALVTLLSTAAFADAKSKTKQPASGDLVSQLPASDVVATVNLKRLMSEVAPQLLSSQPEKLAEMYAKIDELKAKTGIDLRQYEQLAVGMTYKQTRPGVMAFEPVMVLRGTFSSNALLIAGKMAANGKYRQETVGGKNIAIFTIPEVAKDAPQSPAKKDDIVGGILQKAARELKGEVAAVALDANTLAFGKPEQVRRLVNSKVGVSADLKVLLNRNPNALASFAGNAPENASTLMNFGDDQIAQILNSLKQVYGSFDMNAGNAVVTMATRTGKELEAKELEGILGELRNIGKSFLSMSSSDKNQMLSRVLDNVRITRSLNEVQLQAEMPLSDINLVIGKK
jgi:hypothetical protein